MPSASALVPTTYASGVPLPAILTNAGEYVIQRVLTFFKSHLPNPHGRGLRPSGAAVPPLV
ncbi:MAG: hypothetical protein AAF627_21025 [Myxococcota bacterium]